MKKLLVLSFVMGLFIAGYSQTGKATGPSCSCPSGWGSCSASCLFTDCCICFNPSTSEGGCACYWGIGSCRTSPIGVGKSASGPSSSDAKTWFAFDRFNDFLNFLTSQKIDISRLSKDYQPVQSKYTGQAGKVSVPVSDFNNMYNSYVSFIDGLNAEQKAIVKGYIDSKEKSN